MDAFDSILFESISPKSLSSASFSGDNNDAFLGGNRNHSTAQSNDFYFDSPSTNEDISENVRRQRRKEQNRAAQRAYRERKVNHTMELEGRINYLEVHIEELKVENKQLEEDISHTRVENGVLRMNLHSSRQTESATKRAATPRAAPVQSMVNHPISSKPVLLKDLLMLYGPRPGDDFPWAYNT